jgi:hypothetical protein
VGWGWGHRGEILHNGMGGVWGERGDRWGDLYGVELPVVRGGRGTCEGVVSGGFRGTGGSIKRVTPPLYGGAVGKAGGPNASNGTRRGGDEDKRLLASDIGVAPREGSDSERLTIIGVTLVSAHWGVDNQWLEVKEGEGQRGGGGVSTGAGPGG